MFNAGIDEFQATLEVAGSDLTIDRIVVIPGHVEMVTGLHQDLVDRALSAFDAIGGILASMIPFGPRDWKANPYGTQVTYRGRTDPPAVLVWTRAQSPLYAWITRRSEAVHQTFTLGALPDISYKTDAVIRTPAGHRIRAQGLFPLDIIPDTDDRVMVNLSVDTLSVWT